MKYNGVIQRKFSLLDEHVHELKRYLATERALQICAEIIIDVAERIIAIERAGPVASAADALARLQTFGAIQDAEPYVGIVRFRNLIVHEYEEIDPRLLYTLATIRLNDFLETAQEYGDEIPAPKGRRLLFA